MLEFCDKGFKDTIMTVLHKAITKKKKKNKITNYKQKKKNRENGNYRTEKFNNGDKQQQAQILLDSSKVKWREEETLNKLKTLIRSDQSLSHVRLFATP